MRADIYNLSWLGVGVGLAKAQWGQDHFEVAHFNFYEPYNTYQLKNKEQKCERLSPKCVLLYMSRPNPGKLKTNQSHCSPFVLTS